MNSAPTAIVTGASRGIGAAIALQLAAEGYAVAVNYQGNQQAAQDVVRRIEAAGGKAIAVQADIGTEAGVQALFAQVDAQLGPVRALVNNAAVNIAGDGSVEALKWSDVERVFAVNVQGVFACCREALIRMKKAGGGGIVTITSEAGKFGGNRMTAYAASKAALNTFTVGFAREAAVHGVRVNGVSPGVIDTEAHAMATPERLQGLCDSIPMKRMGKPQEVAEAVAWLLSDKACYVSGAVLSVTGAR